MNNEELYIDGELVDTDGQTKVTLDIKSNLLQDISKIVSNHTYTIKLPKTTKNQRMVRHSDLVQGTDIFPYVTHKARFFRNGVEVVKNGRAVLMATGEAIEVSIVWGLFPAFSELVSKGTTLQQLESNARILWNNPQELTTYADALQAGYFYADYDPMVHTVVVDYTWKGTGTQTSPELGSVTTSTRTGSSLGGSRDTSSSGVKYLHPCVKVSWLLEQIRTTSGIGFAWRDDAKTFIDSLIIPLVAHKATDLAFDSKFNGSFRGMSLGTSSSSQVLSVDINTSSNLFTQTSGTVQSLTVDANANVVFNVSAEWSFDITGAKSNGWSERGGVRTDNYTFAGMFYIKMMVGSEEYIIGRGGTTSYMIRMPSGQQGVVRMKITGYGKIEVKKGQTVTFEFRRDKGALKAVQFIGGTIDAQVMSGEDVPSGAYFPIVANLPNVKIIDFVKFLAAITGTFPLQIANDSKVSFVPLSTVWDNTDNAVDWTAKLVAQYGDNKPKGMEFKLSDWKQHNRYKWKEDDTVVGNYDGDLQIDNDTLELERDVFTFPFAATDGSNVPMYEEKSSSSSGGGHFGSSSSSSSDDSSNDEESGPSYKACKDRILRLYEMSDGKAGAVFDFDMQSVLDDKYSDLARTLQSVKVIKEKIILSDAEIQQFDETRPVYLSQYGRYFAVIEIKSEGAGVSEVTMLQLNLER